MLRTLKAFAWLRWRMLVNSLENTASRDRLERFSLAIERLGPILAGILLIPSALFVAVLGVAAGYLLATGGSPVPFAAVRYLLIPVPLLAIIGPLFLPAADRTNPIRLLLLPISSSTLYVAQTSTAFGDPWNMLLVPLVAGIPIGFAAGGAVGAALISLVFALMLLALISGLSALSTSVLHLAVRDRRRGEWLAVLFILVIPIVALLPGLFGEPSRRGADRYDEPQLPEWVLEAGNRIRGAYPTEQFMEGLAAAAESRFAEAAVTLSWLAVAAVLLHAAGMMAFRHVLASPETTGARRSAPMRSAWAARLPGLSTAASAVALAQLRLALRTPRGRSILLSPLAMFAIFGVMMYRGAGEMEFGPFRFGSGLGLATFASFMSLLSILPIAMNQFAVDRAGLTMMLMAPLRDEELLAGKAAGNALIVTVPILVCLVAALVVFPGGPPSLWLSLVLALLSVHLVVAPIAAMCSAAFPRAVDMNSIGRGSNAHGAAGFIGLIAFIAAGLPPAAITLIIIRLVERPGLAPVLLALWCLLAYVIGRLLFLPARRLFAARRENLSLVA